MSNETITLFLKNRTESIHLRVETPEGIVKSFPPTQAPHFEKVNITEDKEFFLFEEDHAGRVPYIGFPMEGKKLQIKMKRVEHKGKMKRQWKIKWEGPERPKDLNVTVIDPE